MAAGDLLLTGLMAVLLVGIAALLTRIEDWRSYTPLAGGGSATGETVVHREKPAGVIRWLTTVDHKDIGLLYGAYAVIALAVGGIMAMLIRLQLVTPAGALLGPNAYNGILTSHGITMLFLFGTPIIAAFANYFIPLLIGADDMAFPRINAIAFWLLPPAALLIWAGFFLAPITGNMIEPAQTTGRCTRRCRSNRPTPASTSCCWACTSPASRPRWGPSTSSRPSSPSVTTT